MDGKKVRCPKGTYYIDYTDPSAKRVRISSTGQVRFRDIRWTASTCSA
jgi:hypothetical protein